MSIIKSIKVDIYITYQCNLSCTYCYLHNKTFNDINPKILYQDIDFFLTNKDFISSNQPFVFTFIGGEPLLRFDLIQKAVSYIKKHYSSLPVSFNVVTNGTLLDKPKIDFLSKHNFSMVLSLDGNRTTHNIHRIFRNGKGSFDIISRNLKYLTQKLKRLVIRMTVTPQHTPYLESSLKFLLHINNIGFGFVPTAETSWTGSQLISYKKAVISLIREWETLLHTQDKLIIPLVNYILHWNDNNFVFNLLMHPCQLGSYRYSIDIDGNIYPCHRFVSFTNKNTRFIIGNINTKLEHKTWVPEIKPTDLNYFGCPALNYDLYQDFNHRNPMMKKFYNIYQSIVNFVYKKHPNLVQILKNKGYDKHLYWKTEYLRFLNQ